MVRMTTALAALVALAIAGLVPPPAGARAQQYAAGPYHPMDALTVDEVLAAVRLVREAGLADDATRFPMITLREMPKSAVRAWRRGQPFTRSALVVMRRSGRTEEAVVDLTGEKVVSHREIPGAQPSVMNEEWQRAQRLVMDDPRWQAAMRARGFDDLTRIFCAPIAAGRFPGENDEGRRLLKVPCYDTRENPDNPHGRPIEGVLAVVDVDADRVASVIDSGAVAVADAPGRPRKESRPPLRPVVATSPSGPNFEIRGTYEVKWQNWSFHLRAERRFGPVLSLVRFRDGDRDRDIAYQMALSEMFVPYMDPDPQWAFRAFLDAGEYGLGYLASPLKPGADCPAQSAFIDLAMPSDTGGLFRVERGLCIFERPTGDPLWRHAPSGASMSDSRPAIELVVRMIPTIGNYDYVTDWVFTQHGNIRIRVGATGFDAVKTVATRTMDDDTAAADTRYGTLVAPNAVATYHDHFFSFRLDLDVDGTANTLVRERLAATPVTGPRRSIWTLHQEDVTHEGPVLSSGHDEVFRLQGSDGKTSLGHVPSIHIEPGHTVQSLLSADDPAQARAAFSAHRLWLTRYESGELYAAGAYPNQAEGGAGLPAYVADRAPATDTDLVVWYTMGFHHLTRAEDWPILPTKWHEVTLRPFNFFDRNPSADVPASFRRPGAAQ